VSTRKKSVVKDDTPSLRQIAEVLGALGLEAKFSLLPKDAPMQQAPVPTCKDCRWYQKEYIGMAPVYIPAMCKHSATRTLVKNPVYGDWNRMENCSAERHNNAGKCGPSGLLYEPKRSIWRSICESMRHDTGPKR
jgi:hypothetical protein